MEKIEITKIKLNPNNPRLIKDDKFKKLVQSIKDFPEMLDIRPIVVNKEMIILGGNMRYKACKEAGLKQVPIIIADLTEDQQKEFLIKDNTSGGEWDFDLLANEWDAEQLEAWGLDLPIDDKIDKLNEGEVLEFEQSVQLIPPKEYILIMAEPNSEDWEDLKSMLKLKMVRRGGYKEGSSFESISLERVLNFDDFKKRIDANSSTE
jgi:hypothetical protein